MSAEGRKSLDIEFRECPDCGGYGVRDNGDNCVTCGGVGKGGVYPLQKAHMARGNMVGSGDIMVERGTGRIVSLAEFMEHHTRGRT